MVLPTVTASAALATAKLLLAPALIGLASLIMHYWGPTIGGWFVALPLTSGPVVLLLALDRGSTFAAGACVGILLAIPALAGFALVYARTAPQLTWGWSSLLGCVAYLACTALVERLTTSITSSGIAFSVACVALVLAIRAMPSVGRVLPRPDASTWDIPLRMGVALVMVWAITRAAGALGPRASGLLTPFPVVATILAAFTHRAGGAADVQRMLRSLLTGLFSFAIFFLVAGTVLLRWHIAAAFASAAVAALTMHAIAWHALRARSTLAVTPEHHP